MLLLVISVYSLIIVAFGSVIFEGFMPVESKPTRDQLAKKAFNAKLSAAHKASGKKVSFRRVNGQLVQVTE